MWRKIALISFFVASFQLVYATHNKAGDITYKHVSGLTYEIIITIFADINSPAIVRKDIKIDWDDNTDDSLRVSSEVDIGDGTLKRTWIGQHTYPGPGSYRIRVEDPNRNAGVNNIDNSVNVPFTLETLLRIFPSADLVNNSVILLNDPVDRACNGVEYRYNPGAYDPDGDSIAYELIESKGLGGLIAPGFEFPSASNSISVDPETGDLIWDKPDENGIFNVAILIKEYRNTVKISEVLRDLQVLVVAGCENDAPLIISDSLVCIEAENNLNISIIGRDPNLVDNVTLSATGEVLEAPINANFNSGLIGNPTNASFSWNTRCTHVRRPLYNLSVRAEDNADDRGSFSLVNFKTIGIKVMAPAPENFTLNPIGNAIELNWDNGTCQNASGYFLYRRIDSSGYLPGNCSAGVPKNIGYKKIASIDDLNNTTFLDNNNGEGLVPGQKYCYLVTSFFSDLDVESKASIEICGMIEKVVPVITNVSVVQTDNLNGSIDLAWSPPTVFDAIGFPPPYRYLIHEQLTNNQEILIDSTLSINDTTFSISNINTFSQAHTYKISLFSLGNTRSLVGRSASAASIFLTISESDETLQLDWSESVPWNNQSYVIFRKHPDSGSFDSLDISFESSYTDSMLINEREYCYFIRSVGSYSLPSVKNPLLNLSQVRCATPIDNMPPCAPDVITLADSRCSIIDTVLKWNDIRNSCGPDLNEYTVYRSSTREGELLSIGTVKEPIYRALNFGNVENIAGCFAVSATDSTGNESELSNKVCINFCPIYELPNVFTPNGDGINDIYTPVQPYRDVEKIDLSIFNRWGDKVFQTADPSINWNGQHMDNDEILNDGVYFYRCFVFEKSLSQSSSPRVLKGTITIIDADGNITD